MAKNDKASTRTSIDDINDSLTSIEQRVEQNKKMVMWAIIGILALVAIICGYVYGIHIPNIEKAKVEISKADMALANQNDSIALVQYKAVADNFSNDPANRASLEAGIILFKQGKYQDAINYISKYDPTETLIGASSQSLIGDCYVNLKNYDEAVKYFEKAIKISDNNPLYTPVFMMKLATVYREQKNYKGEVELFKTIDSKFPEYGQSYNIDIKKYLERAQAQAGE